ncbi:uncharacterized protein ANIA_10174 [Aspergillus nidulans FGSC A4]|uniref:Uncharacterized protein n=1 Tax=Emericella nidulans (strain FGSC A4 / ATCC 38163 / CBS 112.46 / NRRL 194 / M139) TaxID=227321 RepID=C8VSH6_EMENI|nr:hypothetical protein [Aspergillus nidulans FGSC A4]CBF87830.1 TPA: conserved hypothetical protein [Aspergillus nidulans FGSC A4]
MPPRPVRLSTSSLRTRGFRPVRAGIPLRSISVIISQTPKPNFLSTPLVTSFRSTAITSHRQFSSTPLSSAPASSTSGRSQADLIVEELQELYEEATDEFEIATESTDSSTIYAASDRESARDALNNLIVAYELYTSPSLAAEKKDEQGQDQGQQQEQEDEGRLVKLEFDPAELSEEVREEVRKRVGQRVRELKSAVEALEGRAHD